jgi:hypothetical protein
VADKCKRVLDAHRGGEELQEFEHTLPSMKGTQMNNFFDGATDYMSMRTSTKGGYR